MRMESDKDRSKQNSKETLCENSVVRRKSYANSLGIQRCHSDGVLTQQNGYTKRKPASKSSSEASIDGAQDLEEILIVQAYANGFVTNGACALDNNLNSNDTVEKKRRSSNKRDFQHQQSNNKKDSINVKNAKTWSQRAIERRQACTRTSAHKDDSDDDDQVPTLFNGLELNVDVSADRSDYSSDVCNTYRHEADILFGRTRGGVKNDTYLKHLVNNVPSRLDNRSNVDDMLVCSSYHSNSNSTATESIEGLESQPPNYQMVVAPLAIPENLSDEEIASCNGSVENHSEQYQESAGGMTCNINDSCDNDRVQDVTNESLFSSHPDNISNGAHRESEDEGCNETQESEQVAEDEGISNNEECEDGDNNLENDLDEHVEQILEQTRPSSSSSFDSIDDIGDFIEADLPPNVERLAFFARESSSSSTTEEDEGCGDEVLPNPNEDEESENETIDPLTHAEQHHVSGEIACERGIKLLNNTSADLLSYSNDFTKSPYAFMNSNSERGACNIVCNKSTEDNECVGEISGNAQSIFWEERNRLSMESNDSDCFGNSGFSDTDRRNGLFVERGCYCVSCDKLVDKDSQRHDDLGVVVCDKCYNEREFQRNKRLDDGVRKKVRPVQHSISASRHVYKNNSERRNSSDKVTNASNCLVRLSSSDSDPIDRLYVSDSSELVSPDVETGLESVLPSSSASSNGTSVQYNQINSISMGGRHLPGSLAFQRHSVSLEYDTPDEVLYCPYYTRRSRSLDQELSINGTCNRSPEREDPYISVSRSNFQEDESNNQEKVFEKQPYHVEAPIPTYSSSDEEENTRVPAPYPNHENDLQEMAAVGIHSSTNHLVFSHEMNHHEYDMTGQNIIVADEPIYEDIEDLLEVGVSDGESDNRSQSQPICQAISKLRTKKRSRSPVTDVEKVMIWNEYEAYVVQVKQIGTSACGPTAVLNVLKAFDFQVEKEEVTQKISSTMRMEGAPIPYYLFSRYSAGTTAQALVDGVCTVTRGAIKGRFFHFYPKRDVDLLKWLGQWMKKGAVPVATLNLQRGVKPGWTIPDAWHHQMVYGVSSKGVYLTNPLEIVPESVIMEQLTSDSVLLVRKQDVVSRFRDWCPLNEILKQRDPRWMTMNVLGQIVHMLREQCMPQDQLATMRSQLTSHICIPAAYKAGIILYMRSNSEFFEELMQAPELPLKDDSDRS